MNLHDPVRTYHSGGWYDLGEIIEIEGDFVIVDFSDWKQRYSRSEIAERYIHFETVLVALAPGETIERFT